MKKILDTLSGGWMTIISGIFLAFSLVLLFCKVPCRLDPAWGAVVISGIPLACEALEALLKEKKITADLLVTVAMIACLWLGEFFAAGEIAFIMTLGEILEKKTIERAKKGLRRLMELVPSECRVLSGSELRMVLTSDVSVGDVIRILPGETIPLDGVVQSGSTSVDQSAMTGESIPVDKSVGEPVLSGSINCFGSIDVEVTRCGENSSLQKLIKMVKDAESNRAPMQKKVDKWAAWLVPAALMLAVVTYFCTMDVMRAVTILVVFCPCALVLATPTSIVAAIGQASKFGVLIKSGEALETMGKADVIVLDKTGTLTAGHLSVTGCVAVAPFAEKELLTAIAAAETKSEHPLGRAIMAFVEKNQIDPADPECFEMTSGKGVKVVAAGKRILCGNEKFLRESGVELSSDVVLQLFHLRSTGCVAILCAIDGKLAGVVTLSDTLRPEAKEVIQKLKALQLAPWLLTGDHRMTAAFFAREAGIENFKTDLLPEDKSGEIAEIRRSGKVVCMVGDGINDAPALKIADVGIAMGKDGSDIAVDAADVVLLKDDLSRLPYLKRLANATSRSITVNITISMVINVVAVLLSVLGVMGPVAGALVHNAGSVLVILNAALLYDRKI